MDDIPPEILLHVFHWAALDETLLDNDPSWRNYDLTSHDANDPWAAPLQDAAKTAIALSGTCKRFRSLSEEFIYRHVQVADLKHMHHLNRIFADGNRGGWVKRLTLSMFKEDVWRRENTEAVCTLIRACPNVEVFCNEIVTGGGTLSRLEHSSFKLILPFCARIARRRRNCTPDSTGLRA